MLAQRKTKSIEGQLAVPQDLWWSVGLGKCGGFFP